MREKNHKRITPICYTCTQFINEVKLLKKTQRISGIDLGWISTLIYSFHHTSDFCGFLSSYKQKSHIFDLITIYAKIKVDWETFRLVPKELITSYKIYAHRRYDSWGMVVYNYQYLVYNMFYIVNIRMDSYL